MYLTDVVKIMNQKGLKTGAVIVEDNTEILSLNTKLQLEMLTRILGIKREVNIVTIILERIPNNTVEWMDFSRFSISLAP